MYGPKIGFIMKGKGQNKDCDTRNPALGCVILVIIANYVLRLCIGELKIIIGGSQIKYLHMKLLYTVVVLRP